MPGTNRNREYADHLNDWLDHLVAGEPRAGTGIDPVAVATIDRFFARDDAPPPPPGLDDQVWKTVMKAAAPSPLTPDSPVVSHANGNGRHTPAIRQPIPVAIWTGSASAARAGRTTSRARRWPSGFAHASSVLLLVLTLGLGFLALVLGQSPNPAVNAPGRVTTAPTHPAVDMAGAETLLTLTLSPELLPQSPERGVTRHNFIVHPGTSGRWQGISKTCCPGVRVDYIVEGDYTILADGPIDVRWADGREETIPAGTEFVLGPGDRMIVPEGVGFDNANNGDVPVRVLGWYLYRGKWTGRTSINWWNDTSWEWTTALPAQPGAVTLQIDKVQLAPGADVPPSNGSIQFVVSLDNSARLGHQSDGSYRNVGNAETTVYVLTTTASSATVSEVIEQDPERAGDALLALTLPPELLPDASELRFLTDAFLIQPGTTGEWLGTSIICCTGVRVDYVTEGEYTVRPDGPIEVRRAGGREETVPAGTEIVLGPGDSMIVPEGTGFINTNNGDVPVQILGWFFHGGTGNSMRAAANWIVSNMEAVDAEITLPPHSAVIKLELTKVQLSSGDVIPPDDDAMQFVVTLDQMAMLGEQSDGSFRNVGKSEITAFVMTTTTAPSDPSADASGPESAAPTPASSPQADGNTLLSLTLTSDRFPPNVWKNAVLVNATIPAHTQGAWPGVDSGCCSGVRIDYVAQGNVTIQAEGEGEVVWADGRLETIPANREFALGPGDTLITPRDVPFVNANDGDEPVRLVGWVLEIGPDWKTEVSNWHQDSSADFPVIGELPADPEAITFTLRRMEIPAVGDVPATPGALRFVASLDPAAMFGERSDGTVRNVGSTTATAYVLTMEPAEAT